MTTEVQAILFPTQPSNGICYIFKWYQTECGITSQNDDHKVILQHLFRTILMFLYYVKRGNEQYKSRNTVPVLYSPSPILSTAQLI